MCGPSYHVIIALDYFSHGQLWAVLAMSDTLAGLPLFKAKGSCPFENGV